MHNVFDNIEEDAVGEADLIGWVSEELPVVCIRTKLQAGNAIRAMCEEITKDWIARVDDPDDGLVVQILQERTHQHIRA